MGTYLGIGAVILIIACLCDPNYDGSGYVGVSINGVPSKRPKGPWWAHQILGRNMPPLLLDIQRQCPVSKSNRNKGDPRALPDDASASAHVQDAGSTNLAGYGWVVSF